MVTLAPPVSSEFSRISWPLCFCMIEFATYRPMPKCVLELRLSSSMQNCSVPCFSASGENPFPVSPIVKDKNPFSPVMEIVTVPSRGVCSAAFDRTLMTALTKRSWSMKTQFVWYLQSQSRFRLFTVHKPFACCSISLKSTEQSYVSGRNWQPCQDFVTSIKDCT